MSRASVVAVGLDNRITVLLVDAVLVEALGNCNRVARRILASPQGRLGRVGRTGPPFDGCGEDLSMLGPGTRSRSFKNREGSTGR